MWDLSVIANVPVYTTTSPSSSSTLDHEESNLIPIIDNCNDCGTGRSTGSQQLDDPDKDEDSHDDDISHWW